MLRPLNTTTCSCQGALHTKCCSASLASLVSSYSETVWFWPHSGRFWEEIYLSLHLYVYLYIHMYVYIYMQYIYICMCINIYICNIYICISYILLFPMTSQDWCPGACAIDCSTGDVKDATSWTGTVSSQQSQEPYPQGIFCTLDGPPTVLWKFCLKMRIFAHGQSGGIVWVATGH